ncbi:MAG TPA: D-glucuronyl C5-epimerase family protein [Solirubrobacteraceae bacterium]|nr:D-glucuronyl C5-epimerase family protein [Solirubrobacteraceae bacterium]
MSGYPIDLRSKAPTASWPPHWLDIPGSHRFVRVAQWGLGAYERYLAGEGDEWLAVLEPAIEYLLSTQVDSGPRQGAWLEPLPSRHTFFIPGSWPSAMAQGECASLLVRVYLETGKEELAQAAIRALAPLSRSTADGGVQARLRGHSFPEEYPTTPPSFVLNGAMFALWGVHDVWRGLDDAAARHQFLAGTDMLVENLPLWDLGYWSRYDLYPHRAPRNVASPSYHRLHITQLRAYHRLEPRPELAAMADRFEAYAGRPANLVRAYLHKVAFRLIVPSGPRFAGLSRAGKPRVGPANL